MVLGSRNGKAEMLALGKRILMFSQVATHIEANSPKEAVTAIAPILATIMP